MKFSQRIGKQPVKSSLQVDGMDEATRNQLWNHFIEDYLIFFTEKRTAYGQKSELEKLYTRLWKNFFKLPIDSIPQTSNYDGWSIDCREVLKVIRTWYFKSVWYELYDFFEALSSIAEYLHFQSRLNETLKREQSGYRLINGHFVRITSEEEIQEIEEAINNTDSWSSVNTHLTTALNFLADKKNPNYRNSIKESISAVEALCVIITGNNKASLGQALTEIEKKHTLHEALKKSFSSLYGYTSDASGIRHSLIENGTDVDFEEAKFMLVTCSAFINFLKAKYSMT